MFCQKVAAVAALKKAAPALGFSQQKIGSGSTLKVADPGGSGSATLFFCRLQERGQIVQYR